MKNNYLITIGIFLPVLLTSCRSDQTIPTVIQETTTRPVVTEVLSDIIDTCKFIPLETASDKSLVGHISKILKYKDKFYIATDNKRILVFNTDGFLTYLRPAELREAIRRHGDDGTQHYRWMREHILDRIRDDDNPVLVEFRFKPTADNRP